MTQIIQFASAEHGNVFHSKLVSPSILEQQFPNCSVMPWAYVKFFYLLRWPPELLFPLQDSLCTSLAWLHLLWKVRIAVVRHCNDRNVRAPWKNYSSIKYIMNRVHLGISALEEGGVSVINLQINSTTNVSFYFLLFILFEHFLVWARKRFLEHVLSFLSMTSCTFEGYFLGKGDL